MISTITLGIVIASPNTQEEAEESPVKFLVAVFTDANDRGLLSDTVSDLLSDWFVRERIAPHTGETPEVVRERLWSNHRTLLILLGQKVQKQSPFQFLIDVLNDADGKHLLSDTISDLLASWFIENLIAPHTGETTDQVRERLTLAVQQTPTPVPTPIPTPVVPTAKWSAYKNGVYGYSISVPSGWTLDEDSETNEQAPFRLPDGEGASTVWAGFYPGSESVDEMAEKRRNELAYLAQSESWPVFRIVSGEIKSASGVEFYELVYHRKPSDQYCASRVAERIYAVSLYPSGLEHINPILRSSARIRFARDRSADKHSYKVGVMVSTEVCEIYLDTHTAATTAAFQNTLLVWDRYWDDHYGYGLNIPPGWTVARYGFGSVTLASPDGSAVVEANWDYYSDPNSTIDDLKAQRVQQYQRYASAWTLFETQGGIQSIGRRLYGTYPSLNVRPEKYLATFRAQVDSQSCVMDYSELMVLSTYHHEHPYGFLVIASVCEDSAYYDDSRAILDGFRY